MLVTKEFTFDSAHNIPDYQGKCERLHGHTYRLRVTVEAPVDPDSGIAVDFCEVSDLVKSEVIEVLDHTYLNETVPVSTAENVAVWIWSTSPAVSTFTLNFGFVTLFIFFIMKLSTLYKPNTQYAIINTK